MPTVYLISGANRGIGLGMVQSLAKEPDTIIFAGARDVSSESLAKLAKQYPEAVIPIALTSADLENNKQAAKVIEEKVGKVDVVIANAGIARSGEPLAQASLTEMTDHFNTNVLGPLALFQATQSLLQKSSGTGKFVVISSLVGSTSDMMALPMGVYSTSKAAVNHLTVKLQSENKDLIILPVCPGPVQTDMGNAAGKQFGWDMEKFAMTVEVSVDKVLKHIKEAEYEEAQQTLWSASDKEIAW